MSKNELKEFALRENEEILRTVRHHPIVIVPHLIVCFLITVLDFFLMYYLFLQGWWGVILFGGVIAVVVFYVMRLFFLYRGNRFVVTNLRIVDFEQAGFFEKFVNEFPYAKIGETKALMKGLGPTLFHYGDLKLFLKEDLGPYELYKIPAPLALQNFINGLIEDKSLTLKKNNADPVSLIMAEVRLLPKEDKEEVLRRVEAELADDADGAQTV